MKNKVAELLRERLNLEGEGSSGETTRTANSDAFSRTLPTYLQETVQKKRVSVAHVDLETLQHPLDRDTSRSVRKLKGYRTATRHIYKEGYEKVSRVEHLGGLVRIGPDQFPELYEIYQGCVERSGVEKEPPLFLRLGGYNAYTGGVNEPYIVLLSDLVANFTTPELEFVIGHELGHIRFEHVMNQWIFQNLANLGDLGGPVFSALVKFAATPLYEWSRAAEFSSDRMGLLVCQDLDAGIRTMVKLAGVPVELYGQINTDAFLRQYEDFAALDDDERSANIKRILTAPMTHPWTVARAYELNRWVESGAYDAALKGKQ